MLFIVTMIAFGVSALLTLWLPPMPIPHRVVEVERVSAIRRIWSDVQEGLVYIKQDAILMKAIAYLTFATTIFMLIAALAPNFVATVVGLPPGDIGYLVAPAGIGVIVGVVIVPWLSSRFRRDALIDWAVVIGGISLLLLSLSREILERVLAPAAVPQMLEVALAGTLAAILGICNALVLVPAQTILQERSHEHIRARVYATFFTITSVVSFVPIFFAAAAADIFGVVTVLAAVAILLIGVGSYSLVSTRKAYRQRHERVRTRHRQGPEAVPPTG
jgi:MFS family permease